MTNSKHNLVGRQSSTRDLELLTVLEREEQPYPTWWSQHCLLRTFFHLPNRTPWNCFICSVTLLAVILVAMGKMSGTNVELFFNVPYVIHVAAMMCQVVRRLQYSYIDFWTAVSFLMDLTTFSHYMIDVRDRELLELLCYYVRLHRPFRYLWSLNNENMKGSVLGTTLKYCYIFIVVRVTWALIWIRMGVFSELIKPQRGANAGRGVEMSSQVSGFKERASDPNHFLFVLYVLNKLFIPIGPSQMPGNDLERITCLLVMLSGSLVVTGIAVASLSLVISLYMGPEEIFRSRYKLIMNEMKGSHVPQSLRDKVETFYKMYWHKQKAVSATRLLPLFPPTLCATVHTDIYFRATQKSRILRDLSYQFLSELAKRMQTIHYIPGDAIIKRNTMKSAIIYVTYGDVEMLTAEDDSTAILRMVRGTILSPCAGCPAACTRAHVEIRAATFCIAHVLYAPELWKTAIKYGQKDMILGSFYEHLERVRKHYCWKIPEKAPYKSSILHFKRKLMNLKEANNGDKSQLAKTDVMMEIAGSYVMRNRADASLTEESDAICLRMTFPCVLQPSSSLLVAWHSFATCVILAVCITHPYYLVYKKEVPVTFRFYDYIVSVIFVFDLFVHLSTAENVEDGVPITLAQTASKQARSKWFFLDVIATVPIFEFTDGQHFAGINKLLRLHKSGSVPVPSSKMSLVLSPVFVFGSSPQTLYYMVFRMLKAVEDECVYHSSTLRFLSYSLLLLIACYLLAALQQGFMCYGFDYCLVTNITHSPYWTSKPLDDTVESRLTFSLYWSISMITFTTHMQDFGAADTQSILYIMFVLELCIVLHIYMEAVYSATIMVTTALRENFDACIESVTNFLIKNNVEPVLTERFKSYLELCWYTDKAYSMTNKNKSIFHDLPPHVHQDIVTRQRSKYMLCIPFMKLLHKEELKTIASNARVFCTCPNEILLNTGDVSNEMYVIKQGICEVLCPINKTVVGELTARNHFGVVICLLRLPSFYTIRAVTHVQLFSISRKFLVKAAEIPQIRDAIEFAKEQPEYELLQASYPPFVSFVPPQPIPNVERFPLPRKYESDFAFLHPFSRLGFLSILRYIFPRFTIRPDGPYLARYEWYRASCALLSAVIFPAWTYFVFQWQFVYYMGNLLDLTAYLDIVQRFLVGYYNDKGLLVYHPASTAAHYLKGTFLIDLLACLPLENLEIALKETYGKLKAIPPFLALLNVLTCLIIFNSVKLVGHNEGYQLIPFEDDGGSWIHLYRNVFRFNLTENAWNLHLATYFWVVYETTNTGYNTFNPSNFTVMRILIVGMIIGRGALQKTKTVDSTHDTFEDGAMITTYFSVRIISTRANVNKELASFQQHLKDIENFMMRENFVPHLKKQVLEYYKHNWDKMAGMDIRRVLKLCDHITLRTDAILYIYGPTFSKCPILNKCNVALLRIIGRAVRTVHFLKDTFIITEDDIISDLYIVDQGVIELIYRDYENVIKTVKLAKGSMFGNLRCLETLRCTVDIVSKTQVHLLYLKSQIFHNILAEFPNIIDLLDIYLEQDENYIMGTEDTILFDSKEVDTSPMLVTCQRLFGYIQSKTSLVQIYLIVISLGCIYLDVYNAGFQDNSVSLIVLLYLMDLGFCWKFLIQCFLPYSAGENNELISSLWKQQGKYFETEFKIDVLSVIPFEVLALLSETNQLLLFSFLRLNRLLRIVTVYKCVQSRHENISINLILTTTISVSLWMTIFIHVTTCLWYFIGVMEEEVSPKSSWFYSATGEPLCDNKYICSLYFVLTTFTQNGVGDILPKKQSEVIFVSILQLLSTMIYMIYVGEFSNIIQYYSFRSFGYYCKIIELQEYLKNNRVSENLVKLVHKYSLHLWAESRGVQLPHFLTTAPHCLKLEIMAAAYLHHLNAHPIFRNCEPVFLRQLVAYLHLYTYRKGMYVVKENERTDNLYIVHSGRVLEKSEHNSTTRLYFAGETFGTIHGLVHNLPYTYSYITVMNSQVLYICLNEWEYLLKHFPDSKEVIERSLKHKDSPDGDVEKDKKDRRVTIVDDTQTDLSDKEPSSESRQSVSTVPLQRSTNAVESNPQSVDSQKLSTNHIVNNEATKEVTFIDTTETVPIEMQPEKSLSNLPKETTSEINQSESQIKLTDQDLLLNEEEEATEALLAKIEGTTVQSSNTSRISLLRSFNKEDVSDSNLIMHIRSVEDYILGRYGEDSPEPTDRDVKEVTNDEIDEPTSTARLKLAQYDVKDENKQLIMESHELKAISDLSTNERNLKSLDSDVEPSIAPEVDNKSVALSEGDSDTSVNKIRKSRKEPK